jgi:uncharacterized protein
MTTHSLLWRRLDVPGHDACRFHESESGWEIDGTAVFLHEGLPARLAYRVVCDREWQTREGSVRGFVGTDLVTAIIERDGRGTWKLDGRVVPGLESHRHLDFGFTPATNFQQVQQLALAVGQAADLPAAWLDVPPSGLQLLPQRYERRSASTYWYESPTAGYEALLELTPDGFIRRYPGLWELEE